MDGLNPQNSFGFLLALPLAFCPRFLVTNAAYALHLAAVCDRLVISVAAFAVGLLAIDVPLRSRVFHAVFFCRYDLKVLRVYAVTISAYVIDHKAFWNFSFRSVVANPVRPPACAAKKECSVAILVQRGCPKPAVASHGVLAIESRKLD